MSAPSVYDPAKAHEYYLRTRELKGRKPASAKATSAPKSRGRQPIPVKKPKVSKAAVRAAARHRELVALKARLEKLQALLRELVQQAKARSGVDSNKKSTSSRDANDDSDNKKLSPAEKRKAAKAAHDRYEKDKKTESKPDTRADLKRKIKNVRAQIKKMREKLAKLQKTQRRKPSDKLSERK